MRRATVFALATLFALPVAASVTGASGPVATGPGLIRDKQPVPDDPLAGLPTGAGDEGARNKGGGGKSQRLCRVDAAAADPREIGDLRATLAFVKRGLTSWSCPARTAGSNEIRLRIAVDGSGKITDVEPAGGDSDIARALAKKLVGKTTAPHLDRPTLGTTVLKLTSSKK
jgi:hypothetical protein